MGHPMHGCSDSCQMLWWMPKKMQGTKKNPLLSPRKM